MKKDFQNFYLYFVKEKKDRKNFIFFRNFKFRQSRQQTKNIEDYRKTIKKQSKLK